MIEEIITNDEVISEENDPALAEEVKETITEEDEPKITDEEIEILSKSNQLSGEEEVIGSGSDIFVKKRGRAI